MDLIFRFLLAEMLKTTFFFLFVTTIPSFWLQRVWPKSVEIPLRCSVWGQDKDLWLCNYIRLTFPAFDCSQHNGLTIELLRMPPGGPLEAPRSTRSSPGDLQPFSLVQSASHISCLRSSFGIQAQLRWKLCAFERMPELRAWGYGGRSGVARWDCLRPRLALCWGKRLDAAFISARLDPEDGSVLVNPARMKGVEDGWESPCWETADVHRGRPTARTGVDARWWEFISTTVLFLFLGFFLLRNVVWRPQGPPTARFQTLCINL